MKDRDMRQLGVATLMLWVTTGATLGQTLAERIAGGNYARLHCAECHSVEAAEVDSPVPEAPPFQEIARNPEMSEYALTVFFRTSHPTMPNLIVAAADVRNLVAYIRGLDD
jgi:hypothetical protein